MNYHSLKHIHVLIPIAVSLCCFQVDKFLDSMTTVTKELEQQRELAKITNKCTANDLKMVIRLLKHDLRISAGAKHM